jgi:hypothetical protein
MSHVFRIRVATLLLMFGFLAVVPLRSADSTDGAVQREFEKTIRPFLTTYCFAVTAPTLPRRSSTCARIRRLTLSLTISRAGA